MLLLLLLKDSFSLIHKLSLFLCRAIFSHLLLDLFDLGLDSFILLLDLIELTFLLFPSFLVFHELGSQSGHLLLPNTQIFGHSFQFQLLVFNVLSLFNGVTLDVVLLFKLLDLFFVASL